MNTHQKIWLRDSFGAETTRMGPTSQKKKVNARNDDQNFDDENVA